jgi:hypothetical protein
MVGCEWFGVTRPRSKHQDIGSAPVRAILVNAATPRGDGMLVFIAHRLMAWASTQHWTVVTLGRPSNDDVPVRRQAGPTLGCDVAVPEAGAGDD